MAFSVQTGDKLETKNLQIPPDISPEPPSEQLSMAQATPIGV
jgi:hypothetical protein